MSPKPYFVFKVRGDIFVLNAQHFLPHGNNLFVERQEQNNVIPITYAIIDPPVRCVHHISQNIVSRRDSFRLVSEPQQHRPKHAVIRGSDKALSERQCDAGIAFHYVAVIQHDGRICLAKRRYRARLQEKYLAVLYRKLYVIFAVFPEKLLYPLR